MVINELTTTNSYRLYEVMNILEHEYSLRLDFANTSVSALESFLKELDILKTTLSESSSFVFKNRDKKELFLVQEAVKLFLSEVTN